MWYVVSVLFLGLSIYYRDSKKLTLCILIYMWVLFAFSNGNIDYQNYLDKYNSIMAYSGDVEPLYALTMKIFNLLNFTYTGFLAFVATIFIFSLYKVVSFLTTNTALALGCIMVFPFPMLVVTSRYTFALSFIMLSLYLYFKYKTKKALVLSISFIIIAILIHFSTVIYLLFWLPQFLTKRKILIVIAVIAIVSLTSVFFNNFILNILSSFTNISIINRVNMTLIDMQNRFNFSYVINFLLKVVIIQIFFFTIYYFVLIKNTKNEINYRIKTIFIFNTLMIPIVFMMLITVEFWRIQMFVMIINICIFSNYSFNTSIKNSNFNYFINNSSVCLIYAIMGSVMWITGITLSLEGNFKYVIRPLLENNLLLPF